ncbi:MAG: glycosyltransferase family 4 protein [Candidatus Omnitrophica bacterium]|nr:glycosyltransferase family 4 protein [Candidatus Omnitrophota bacterium]
MRIVHAIPYFPPANCFGGVPEAVYSLVQAQARLGHEIIVLTTDAGLHPDSVREGLTVRWVVQKAVRAVGEAGGIRIFYMTNRNPLLARKYKIFTASFWNPSIEEQLPASIDILHLHDVHIPGYRRLCVKMMERGAGLCLSSHGSFAPPVHRGLKRAAHKWMDPLLRRRWILHVSAFFALCREEKKQLERAGTPGGRIHVLPHGRPRFESPASPLPFPAAESSSLCTFLYAGRLHRAKGVMILMEAFVRLIEEGAEARLIFCGPDEGCAAKIQSICSANHITLTRGAAPACAGVALLPKIPRSAMPALFSLADFTVCPSPYEIFGLTPVESLICGTPVIAASSYGCLEHLPDSCDAIRIVTPGSAHSLQAAMSQCLLPDQAPPRFHPESILPPWDEIARRTCDIYDRIIRR